MNNLEILQSLQSKFNKKIIETDESADICTITIETESVIEIISYLKTDLNFIYLTDLCGVHFPDQEKELGVIYHLHNLVENVRFRIKTFVQKSNPKVDSIIKLFSGANWMERETFDFYGIEFQNHPNLKRILNVEYMDYHPLRKEYPLEDATRTDKDDCFFGR